MRWCVKSERPFGCSDFAYSNSAVPSSSTLSLWGDVEPVDHIPLQRQNARDMALELSYPKVTSIRDYVSKESFIVFLATQLFRS